MYGSKISSEQGQAIVIFAVALVVLLGFTALAIDGSMVYADRRYAQNGADSASLAGAGAGAQALGFVVTSDNWTTIVPGNCRDGNAAPAAQRAKEAAQARATGNDFTITPVIYESEYESSLNAVWTECGETIIPPTGFHRKFMDVLVKITHETTTSFAQLVFGGKLANTNTATARIYPAEPYGFGQAIIALNPSGDCNSIQDGLVFHGDPDLYVQGSGIWSNHCVVAKDPSIDVTIESGNIYYGALNVNDDAFTLLDGTFEEIDEPLDLSDFNPPVPDCTGHTVSGSSLINQTGLSGLYCVTGDMEMKVNATDTMAGTDVTFVMLGGDLMINGHASTSLTAPPIGYSGTAMPGILFYLPIQYYGDLNGNGCGDPKNEFKITGNSGNVFGGTILAPCTDVVVLGTSDNFMYDSQVIGWNVEIGGTTGMTVNYDADKNGHEAGYITLLR